MAEVAFILIILGYDTNGDFRSSFSPYVPKEQCLIWKAANTENIKNYLQQVILFDCFPAKSTSS